VKAKTEGKIHICADGVIEADNIQLIDEPKKREVREGDVGFDKCGKLFIATNQSKELGSCETKYFDGIPVTLFNLLDLVSAMQKVKNGKIDVFNGHGNKITADIDKDGDIRIEILDGAIVTPSPVNAFNFAAQLLALCSQAGKE
jgi:hypothetical protein